VGSAGGNSRPGAHCSKMKRAAQSSTTNQKKVLSSEGLRAPSRREVDTAGKIAEAPA
jgi:hypothetical protein